MSYNDKKFLDQDGLVTLLKKLDNYPTNEILGTVVSAIQMSLGGKIGDVQVNGTSIVDGGIANIPIASTSVLGLVKVLGTTGIYVNSNGNLSTDKATSAGIKAGENAYNPIVPEKQHESVFYGLAKAAGDTTQTLSDNAVGIYTADAKGAIRGMIGAISPAYYATSNTPGLVKPGSGIALESGTGKIYIDNASEAQIKAGVITNIAIPPFRQHIATFYGLAKAAGYDEKNSSLTFGTYTNAAKNAIQNMLGITGIVAYPETEYEQSVYRHPQGQTFSMSGKLWVALRDIEIGDIILPYDNCDVTNVNNVIFNTKNTSILKHPASITSNIQDPTVSAQINQLRANRLAFLPADQIIIEKTTDGGVTWVDAEISDTQKVQLFSELRPQGISIPLLNGDKSTLCGLRVTFTAMKYNVPENTPETQKYNYWNSTYAIDKERYCMLHEFYFWISANSDRISIKAERAKGNAADTWETLFDDNKARFAGWPGNGFVSFNEAQFGGSTSQANQPWNYRITFMTAYLAGQNSFTNEQYLHSEQKIFEIRGYGSTCWYNSNSYMYTDHLYSFDMNQNATFPRSVNAYSFNGKVNGYDINKGVPADAVFTDTTYESKTAASGGTAVSLVTTGEKYTWNQKVNDVQVNGTSIVSSGTANIPIASPTTFGVVKTDANSFGIKINEEGRLYTVTPGPAEMKAGTQAYKPIVPATQHTSVFYGLAKVAGADMASSDNAVGIYTESAKTAIRSMLGATSSNVIAVQDTQPVEIDAKIWMMETAPESVEIPTMEDLEAYVQKTDYASTSAYGLVCVGGNLEINAQGKLQAKVAATSSVKSGTSNQLIIVAGHQHEAAFYGLAKAAGDTTQAASDNAVGTYTTEAKAAILAMLGANGNGLQIINGTLATDSASTQSIKNASNSYAPIVSSHIHDAAFYGLAKAAGDTTQSASSNAVGTYTTEAKAAIHTMLGIDPASIAAQVDIPLVETVSGTTPTITGQPNVRYICGEVSTITITPPANGSVDVIFESGSTATAMTVPSTVKWPAWFDAETLEANTTYEILITDGIYGSVMTWAT